MSFQDAMKNMAKCSESLKKTLFVQKAYKWAKWSKEKSGPKGTLLQKWKRFEEWSDPKDKSHKEKSDPMGKVLHTSNFFLG